MFKVIIIDDEPIIRTGLSKKINWDKLECIVAGEGKNGNEGVDLARRLKPDIIITDIKMPKLDGLDFIKIIRDELPNSQVIFLTGYAEICFAQKAIELGAFGFVLKPTKFNQLEDIIQRACERVYKIKIKETEEMSLKSKLNTTSSIVNDKIIHDILFEPMQDDEIMDRIKLLNFDIRDFRIAVLLLGNLIKLQKGCSEKIDGYKSQIASCVRDIIQDINQRYNMNVIYHVNGSNIVLVLNFLDENLLTANHELLNVLEYVRQKLFEVTSITLPLGLSRFHEEVGHIQLAYQEALRALKESFFGGCDRIYVYENLILSDSAISPISIRCDFYKCLRLGKSVDLYAYLEEFIGRMRMIHNEAFIKKTAIETIANIISTLNEVIEGIHEPELESTIYNDIWESNTFEQMVDYIKQLVDYAIKSINIKLGNSKCPTINRLLDYLENNYHKDISLSTMADHFSMNQWYLSKLVKKETNETFSDLLKKIRIGKAKQLLEIGNYKTYEVSERVGFVDYRYFTQVFKKDVGITPSEYKRMVLMKAE